VVCVLSNDKVPQPPGTVPMKELRVVFIASFMCQIVIIIIIIIIIMWYEEPTMLPAGRIVVTLYHKL